MRHKQPFDISLFACFLIRDLLKQFTTMELMRWSSLVEDYGKELREGSSDSPATDVFPYNEDGEKRWQDLKNRVVEHVSCKVPSDEFGLILNKFKSINKQTHDKYDVPQCKKKPFLF